MALYLLARCTLTILLLLPIAAHAATYYVAASGGSGTCKTNSAAPGSGIAASFGCLSAGDTLYLRGGTYTERLHSGLGTSWPSGSNYTSGVITIASYPGETATLKPVYGPSVDLVNMANASYLVLDSLIFDGSEVGYNFIVRLDTQTHHIRIKNSKIIGNNDSLSTGIQQGGFGYEISANRAGYEFLNNEITLNGAYGIYAVVDDMLIDGNYIHHNGAYGLHLYRNPSESGAIDSINVIVRNNRISSNGGNVSVSPFIAGLLIASSASPKVYNNIVFGEIAPSGGSANGIQVYLRVSSAYIFNNTIVSNASACIENDGDSSVIQNNICYLNGNNTITGSGSGAVLGNNLLGTNPSFVSLVTEDFHLQSGSAAINFGITAAGYTTDKDGNSRGSVGASSDAGAYEFVTTAGTSKGTFFVATSGGSDGNSCDAAKGTVGSPSASPKATINAALGCAASESTIYIRTGTYAEQIDTNSQAVPPGTSWGAPTTLAAYPGETVTLTRNTDGVIIFLRNGANSQYIVFDRLIIDGLNTAGTNGLVTYPGVNHIRFQNGEIKRTYYEGAFIYQSDNIEVLDTACHGTTLIDCIGINNSTNITIRGGSSYSNARDGIAVFATSSNVNIERMAIHDNGANGITTNALTTALIANNLIYDNTVRGIEVQTGSSGVKVYNNTIWSNTGTSLQINSGASGTLHTNNIYYQNGTDTPANSGSGTVGTTNVTANPTFVAPGPTTTFHVSGSNVVGVGTVLAEVTTDYAGVGRTAPYNTIGAYEEGAPPVTPPTNAPVSPYASTNFFIFD